MEFWGVEVPAGKPLTCDPGDDSYVHISQAALGESKDGKSSERVVLKVAVGKSEVVVGTLSHGNCDQTPLDLIFDEEFKLSHNSTSCSVYFCGYKTEAAKGEFGYSSSDEEDIPEPVSIPVKANGKTGVKATNSDKTTVKEQKASVKEAKADAAEKPPFKAAVTKLKVDTKRAAPKGKLKFKQEEDVDEEDGEDNDDDDEDDEMDEDLSDEDDIESDEEDGGEEDESGDEELKSAAAMKRVMDKLKASTRSKKMKLTTPVQGRPGSASKKTEVKPPITPASAKLVTHAKEKSSPQSQSAKGGKSNTPVSGKKIGQYVCKTCDRNFVSESALTQHNTAKHTK